MDAPAMLARKHVPENVAAEEGGQQQLHREEKPHKPVMTKMKDKVKKIKSTITGHGHGNGDEHERNSGEDEEDAAQREAEVEKGGYMEDVEDKPVVADSSPELHGAPMYDSERVPAAKEAERDDAAMGVRLGGLGRQVVEDPVAPRSTTPAPRGGEGIGSGLGRQVVEDPAAPRSTTPAPRGGEDVGTTDVVRDFEKMTVHDDPKQVGAGKMDVDERREAMPVSDGTGEEWKDAPTDAAYGGTYAERLKNTAAGTTEYGKKLASTVYGKFAGTGTAVASKAQQVTPGFGAKGNAQNDSSATATPESMTAGAGAGQRDINEPMPVSSAGTEEFKKDAATDGASGATYTEKVKSAAAGTTDYGKKLASTVYGKVAGTGTAVASKAPQVTPGFGARGGAQDDTTATATPDSMTVSDEPREGMPVSSAGTEELKGSSTDAATTQGASGATYTDKIKSAASTVYQKVAGVGTATAVGGKVQQAAPSVGTGGTPGAGAQGQATAPDDTTTTARATPGAGGPGNGQDKGVTTGVTGYITNMLRPGDEERSLSESITGAVQQRKEGVGSTMAKARGAPAQAVTRARGAVTSLTGGNRVSETVQPTTEGNIKEGVAAEGPELRGQEIGATNTKTNANANIM